MGLHKNKPRLGQFIALPVEILDSPAFKIAYRLCPAVLMVYAELRRGLRMRPSKDRARLGMWANNGEITLPYACVADSMSETTYRGALEILALGGFTKVFIPGAWPNLAAKYKIIEEWRNVRPSCKKFPPPCVRPYPRLQGAALACRQLKEQTGTGRYRKLPADGAGKPSTTGQIVSSDGAGEVRLAPSVGATQHHRMNQAKTPAAQGPSESETSGRAQA